MSSNKNKIPSFKEFFRLVSGRGKQQAAQGDRTQGRITEMASTGVKYLDQAFREAEENNQEAHKVFFRYDPQDMHLATEINAKIEEFSNGEYEITRENLDKLNNIPGVYSATKRKGMTSRRRKIR